ncbi:MAG: DUF255 domain-containing protein [Caldilineaceae bacterium]|nr:DUF255 domain-containing protein [Caldilineaceae bacterium]
MRERPDATHMDAVQSMTGQGGWPMSVWLLPDGKPFHGGTYLSQGTAYGMPGFQQVLQRRGRCSTAAAATRKSTARPRACRHAAS